MKLFERFFSPHQNHNLIHSSLNEAAMKKATNADIIRIKGIHELGCVGVSDVERTTRQPIEVDLEFGVQCVEQAASSDLLCDTLDYCVVISQVRALIQSLDENHGIKLIETLATRIADMILREFQVVRLVSVQVTKPRAPIPDFDGTVSVEIVRQRDPTM